MRRVAQCCEITFIFAIVRGNDMTFYRRERLHLSWNWLLSRPEGFYKFTAFFSGPSFAAVPLALNNHYLFEFGVH